MALAVQAADPEGPKAPTVLAQRRTYIEDWAANHQDEIANATPPSPPPAQQRQQYQQQYDQGGFE
jgi:hypothetical protein